jgi:hypothetical protein
LKVYLQESDYDRYVTLFRWKTEDEIDVLKLVDQWDVDKMSVVSMLNQARRNPNLYDDLRRKGYDDDEFPDWWYSPGRPTETTQEQIKKGMEAVKKLQETSGDSKKLPRDSTRLPGDSTILQETLTPPPPKIRGNPCP